MPLPDDRVYTFTEKDRNVRELSASFRAQIDAMELHGKRLVEEYRNDCAKSLLRAGITLIPSDFLQDHQFVVSRGVYEAARQMADSL